MSAAAAINTLIDTRTGRAIDLAMQKLEVIGRVYPLGSFVRVIHRFKCLGTQPMEAIYVSALPTGGTLRRFKVIGENFEVDSKLEPRKKARKEYEEGVANGHLSVLAETNQDGLVHLSVGQVQPDEEVSVIMDVVVGVTTRDKSFQFRFPFTIAPSYHASAKMVPTEGGGRIELPEDVFGDLTLPEWKTAAFGLHEVTFNLGVHAGTNLATISSPSHRIAVAPQPDGSSVVSLAGMGDTPNRDLVIDVAVPEVSPLLFADATLLGDTPTGNEPAIPTGASRWTALIPSTALPQATKQPRKVCFVLDRSGSMEGQPIVRAKQALLACLSILTPDDEFGIVHFGSDAQTFHPSLVKADDPNRRKALEWVEKIHCNGGTEMLGALAAATRVLGGPGGDVFVLTDGEVFQTGPIVEHMAASKSRVHVLGIGTASQHRFMAQLSRRTGGVCEMVSPRDDVGMAGLKLFNQVKEPVLTDVAVKVDGKEVSNLGTVWEGLPLLVTDPSGDGSLPGTILVKDTIPITGFVQVKVPDGLTALLWAGRQIEDLSSKMDMVSEGTPKRDQIEKRMTDLSVGYGLASRVMSLVAVVERVGDQAGVTPEQKMVSIGTPEGMEDPFSTYYKGSATPALLGGGGITRRRAISNSGRMTKSAPTRSLGFGPDYESVVTLCAEPTRGMPVSAYYANQVNESYSGGDGGYKGIVLSDAAPIGVAAPAGMAPTYDPDDWTFTGNLLADLAVLKSDGGVPGHSIEDRVLHTIILALLVSLEAKQFPGVYDQHIDRMVAFIKANGDTVNEKVALHKALKAITSRTCSLDRKTLESYFYKVQKDVFLALRTL